MTTLLLNILASCFIAAARGLAGHGADCVDDGLHSLVAHGFHDISAERDQLFGECSPCDLLGEDMGEERKPKHLDACGKSRGHRLSAVPALSITHDKGRQKGKTEGKGAVDGAGGGIIGQGLNGARFAQIAGLWISQLPGF